MTMVSIAAPARTAAGELATFCGSLRWAELDEAVRQRTRELLLDLLGVTLGGSRVESSSGPRELAQGAGDGQATLIGTRQTSSADWAALANGTAAHALELDDVTTESSLHPGVAIIPAALGLAEELDASPAAMLEAIVAGYEVTMRVGNALNPASAYARGFHPTGVAGAFGAAMAAGRLLDLDDERLTHALGIAGTLASGSLEYLSNGAWTKRLNAGWAAHAGIVAARLAGAGFTGPSTVFEGRLGALHAYTDEPYVERLVEDLGRPLQVMRVSIKPYACCRYNHGLIDCMLSLRGSFGLDDVERIRLGVLSGGALLVADPIEQKRAPANVVDAQFSAPYASAVALVYGSGSLESYSTEKVADPRVRRLMSVTDCYRDASLDAVYPRQWPAAAEVVLRDGRRFSTRVEYALGEPENPVPLDALMSKFISLAGRDDAEALADRILHVDADPSVRALGTALRSGGGST
ncbi:MAG: MmgE/PrpD family protein [Chloroflexi bacterium]|nr:MmgE/PrpD family protein [Chloroflexota bacterium]